MNRAPVVLKWSLNRRLNAVEVTVRDHLKFESAFFRMRAINRLLQKELQPPSISARTFDRKLNQLVESFSQHAHHEEQVVLPLLTRHLSPARLDLLGHQMISSKKPNKMESAA